MEKIIGKKILELRHGAHLTQEQFAEEIQVHPSYIGPMEKGRKRPSIRTLIRISQRFGIPLHEFFLNTDAMGRGPLRELNALLKDRSAKDQRMVLEMAKSLLGHLRRPDSKK
jgi:transcriptional regulator with XRE-family HTH domain